MERKKEACLCLVVWYGIGLANRCAASGDVVARKRKSIVLIIIDEAHHPVELGIISTMTYLGGKKDTRGPQRGAQGLLHC